MKRFTLSSLLRSILATAVVVGGFSFSAPAMAKVKVGLSDWPGWVAWYVAEQKGYFKKYGADVELVWFPNYTDSISALSAGQLDANSQTWGDTLAPLAKGLPLKAILANDNSYGNDAVMVGPKLKSIKDLKGKKVALEQYSVSHFLLGTALAKNGMSLKDVTVVNLAAGDAAAAFMAGRVDAAALWNPWVNTVQLSGKGKAVFTSKDMPGLIADLVVAQEKSIKDPVKRKDFVAMIRAWFDAVDFIQKNPAEAATIMSKVVGLKPAEYQPFLAGTRFFGKAENQQAFAPTGQLSLLQAGPVVGKFLADNKLLEGKPDYAKGLDGSLLAEALKAK